MKELHCNYVRVEACHDDGRTFFSQPVFLNETGDAVTGKTVLTGKGLKGNLHAHTCHSHGWFKLDELCDFYRKGGYDFLGITDHTWNGGLNRRDQHCVVNCEKPLCADRVNKPSRFTVFSGCETHRGTPGVNDRLHFLMVNYHPEIIRKTGIQQAMNAVNRAGGFVIWHEFPSGRNVSEITHKMARYAGYAGMEIFNSAQETEQNRWRVGLWDELLSQGVKVWGFAEDDLHEVWWPHFKGYIRVYAESNTRGAIMAAIRRGKFYASTGLDAELISMDKNAFHVKVPLAQKIRFVGPGGKILGEGAGNEAQYRLNEKKADFIFDKRLCKAGKAAVASVGRYEFFSETKITERVREKIRARLCPVQPKFSGNTVRFYMKPWNHPPALDQLFMLNGFSMAVYREIDHLGAFMAFDHDKKLHHRLACYDLRKEVFRTRNRQHCGNFLKVFPGYGKRMMLEMSFRVENAEKEHHNWRMMVKNLRKDIEDGNFTRLENLWQSFKKCEIVMK